MWTFCLGRKKPISAGQTVITRTTCCPVRIVTRSPLYKLTLYSGHSRFPKHTHCYKDYSILQYIATLTHYLVNTNVKCR